LAGTGKKWLIGCGAGCAGMILLSILVSVGGALFMTRPMSRAVDAQRDLTAEYGAREAFTPPARLQPERVEVFLAVRREVMESCAQFEEIVGRFQAMEELDSGDGDPSAGEVFQGLKGVMGAVLGMGQAMGEVTQIRNEILRDKGMGMGEYTWIYILAYNSYLGKMPNTGIDGEDGREYSGNMLRLISTLMESHATALEEAADPESAQLWRDELARLKRVDEGVPFPDGALPDRLPGIFSPFRKQLERNYCPALAEFDLGRLKKSGMSFHAD
jgi:hypothetical protein